MPDAEITDWKINVRSSELADVGAKLADPRRSSHWRQSRGREGAQIGKRQVEGG